MRALCPTPKPVTRTRGCSLRDTARRSVVRCRATGGGAPRAPGSAVSATLDRDTDDVWQRLALVQRQLSVAVTEEDYALAARLRDEQKALLESLPPLLQFALGQVAKLRGGGSLEEQKHAIASLGEAGEAAVIPDLAACLSRPELSEMAEKAMWSIFMRCRDPHVNELLAEGCSYMRGPSTYSRALDVFNRVVQMQPTFAEGYNKRATVYYLLSRYDDSIADCKLVLQLQPYHFGAASGLGLCHLQKSEYEEALAAFEHALRIHPNMSNIERFVRDLRTQLNKGALGKYSEDGEA